MKGILISLTFIAILSCTRKEDKENDKTICFTPYSDPTLGIYYNGRSQVINNLDFLLVKSALILDNKIQLNKIALSRTIGGDRIYFSGKDAEIFKKGYYLMNLNGEYDSYSFPFNDEKYYDYSNYLKKRLGLNSKNPDSQQFILKDLVYEYIHSQIILDQNLNYFFKQEKIFQSDTSNIDLYEKYDIFFNALFETLNNRKRISEENFHNFKVDYLSKGSDSARRNNIIKRIDGGINRPNKENLNLDFKYYFSKDNIIEIRLDFFRVFIKIYLVCFTTNTAMLSTVWNGMMR